MNIGGLTIEMAADLARLRQDMQAAKDSVGDAMQGIQRAVDLAKGAFVAYLGVASIGAFKNMVMGAVEATGALHDLSQQTGNSAAALAQFRSVGSYSQTSLESIANASLKLSKNLSLADEEGKGAALALKAMGVDFDTFTKMDPDKRMLAAAQSLAQYQDGADKSAAAMLLFGKEGAKMLPFLADLAKSSDDVTKALDPLSVETKRLQANMADAFGDNLTTIRKQSEGWKKDLSMGLLPAMYEVSQAFVDMEKGGGGLKAQISQLAKDGTLAEWARGAVTALTYLIDVGQALFSLLPMIGKVIAGVASASIELFTNMGDAVQKVLKGDFSGAVDSMQNGFRSVATIGTSTAEDVSKIWNQKLIGETFRDTMAGLKGVQVQGKEAKKQLNLVDTLKANEAARLAEKEAAKLQAEADRKLAEAYEQHWKAGQELLTQQRLKNDQLQLEVDLGRKLTPVELEQIKLTRDMADGKVVLSTEDEKAARAAIAHGAALEAELAWMLESRKETNAAVDATTKRIESLQADTQKQREANEVALLTAQQLAVVRQAKLLDLATAADRKAALLDEIDWTGQLGDQQRELAKAYRESAAVAAQGAAVQAAKEAQEAWQKTIDSVGQGLTDSLFRAFEAGKDAWSTLWKGIKNTVETTALRVLITGVDGKSGIAGSILGALGLGAPGTASAGTGSFSLGSISGIGNLLSGLNGSIGSFLQPAAGGLGSLLSGAGDWLTGGLGNLSTGPFAELGGWLSSTGSSLSSSAGGGMLGDGLGYLGSLYSLSQGKYGQAAGSAIGTAFGGPIGAAIGSAIGGLADKLFGSAGTPQHGGSYVSNGTTGFGVTNGQFGLDRAWGDSVGKYFSSDVQNALKTVTGGAAQLLNGLSQAFGGKGGYQVGAFFASDANRASQGNRSILRDGQVISSWSGSGLDKDPTKGLQQLTDALAGQVKDALSLINLPDWARKQLDALGSGATMQQLAAAVQAIQATQTALKGVSDAFAPLGGVFTKVAGLSAEATLQLAQFAGGIDALVAKTQSFVKNYYSTDEQNAIAAAQIQKALTDAGITAALGSKDDFKALVQSTDVQTEDGRKQLALLLNLNEAFAPVGEYLQQQGKTLADLAAQAPQVAALQALNDSTTSALQLQQQNADSLVQLDDTFNNVGSNLATKLQDLTDSVQAGLATVAANTAQMSGFLARWDGNTGLNVVSA